MNSKVLQTCLLMLTVLIFSIMSLNGFSQTVWNGTSVDVSWYNATDTEFEISTAAELAGIAQLVNGTPSVTFAGKTIKLNSDIWLNANGSTANNWTPIGGNPTYNGEYQKDNADNRFFEGTFDGQNYRIFNLHCEKTQFQAGLFGAIAGENVTIKDLTLINPFVKAKGMVGSLVGNVGKSTTNQPAYIINCMAINANIRTSQSSGNDNIGGLLGGLYPNGNPTTDKGGNNITYVQHCAVTGTIHGQNIGGIAGNGNKGYFNDCYFAGTLDYTGGTGNMGGIVGAAAYSPVYTNCYSKQSGGGKNGTQRTEAQMKEESFVNNDINKNGVYYKMDECNANNGYPLLLDYPCNIRIEGPEEVCAGTQVSLTASNGFETYEWKANGTVISGQTGSTITYTVNATTTFTAKSIRESDDLELEGELIVTVLSNFDMTKTIVKSYDNEEHGTIELSSETISCTNPQPITYTITPASGWYVTKVLVDDEVVDFTEGVNNVVTGTYTPTAGQHGNVTAHFYDKYKITTTLTLDGEPFPNTTLVSPWGTNGVVEVLKGTNQDFEISQTNVYSINSIKVNGELVAMSTTYTFENVQSNQTLEVDYTVDVVTGQIWDGTQDISWYNTTDTDFYIYTAEQLAGLAKLVNDNTTEFTNSSIYLMSDIWLNSDGSTERNWTPIGGAPTATIEMGGTIRQFKGNFYGNGHIIYNMYIDKTGYFQAGLFGCITGAGSGTTRTIENIGLINPHVKSRGMMGALIGLFRQYNYGDYYIKNCMVINATLEAPIVSGNNNIGTIVGATYGAYGYIYIQNCLGTGNLSGNHTGGISGNGARANISNSYFYGELTSAVSTEWGGITSSGGSAANCYSNAVDGAGASHDDGITIEQMLSPIFLVALNVNPEVPAFKIDCGINQGLPIMEWYDCSVDVTGPTEVCAGTEITLNASGYDTYTWKHNLDDTFEEAGESLTFTVEEDMIFTVIGKLTAFPELAVTTDYEVTVNEKMNITVNIRAYDNGIHGTVAPMIEEIDCGDDDPVTFEITPDAGWHISEILINGEHERGSNHTDGATVNFTYNPEDISAVIDVHFSDEYFVTASVELQNGDDLDAPYLINDITKDGKVFGKGGEDLTITFNETGKYHIVDVIVNNENKGRLSSYTFANLDRDSHVVRVVYKEECGILSIPYAENFDFYGTGAGLAPDCWTYIDSQDANNNRIELTSAQYSSAGASLLMTSASEQNNFTIVQLPDFSEDIMDNELNNLQVRFKLYTTNVNVKLEVGFASFDMTQIPPVWRFDTIAVISPTEMGEWDEFEVSLANYTPSTLRKLSFKVEGKNATGTNGLYIDDLVIDYLPTCPRPTNIVLNDVDGDYVVVSWEKGSTEDNWEVVVVERGELPSTGTPIAKATNEEAKIDNLNPLTEYDLYVRALCGVDETSIWSKPFKFRTPQILARIPYKCDFENVDENTNWEFKSDKTPNKWYLGDVVNNGGENAIYISGDGGETNKSSTWTTNINGSYIYGSYVYAFRTIAIDKAGTYTYSYDWRNKGYNNNYNYLRVMLAPESVNFNGGSATLASDTIRIDGGNLFGQVDWQTITGDVTITEPGNYNLIFYYYCYYNYNSDAYQPAPAIDNIVFRSASSPLATIDPNNLIKSEYPTCLNRNEEDAKEVLPETVELETEEGFIFTADLTWTITGYDSSTTDQTFNVKGTFSLPKGVAPSESPVALEVNTTLYVNPLPVVICPTDPSTSVNYEITLIDGDPAGGVFSGAGVDGNTFDPTGLLQGNNEIIYTYTDPITTCVNSCLFNVNVVFKEITAKDIYNEVESIDVCEGTSTEEVIARLEKDIIIKDSDDEEKEVSLTWTIEDYDPSTTGGYTATGAFELPHGVLPNDAVGKSVTTTITVIATPVLTCPVIQPVLVNAAPIDLSELEDNNYPGGAFIGSGIINNVFYPSNLKEGTYTMIYSYEDYATNCATICTFDITVTYPTVVDVDIDGVLAGNVVKCAETSLSEIISELPSSMRIKDSENVVHTVSITGWTITGYDEASNEAGNYTANAVYSLGSLKISSVGLDLNVTKTVEILGIPEVICPADVETTVNNYVVLAGATPEGGVYSGTNVTDGIFNPKGLEAGDYTITYTSPITSSGVTCSSFCNFTITITYPELEVVDYTSIVPEEKQFCIGTEKDEIINVLPTTIVLNDSDNMMHDVTLTWDIVDYEASVAEEYTAVGTFSLPANIANTSGIELKVETSIVLNALPVVTCPASSIITQGTSMILTGATPIGGTYSGNGVSANGLVFNQDGNLATGTYSITYNYTDLATGCANSCTFEVEITGAQISGIDVENDVQSVEVCMETPEATIKEELVSQIKISDSNGSTHTVNVTWTVPGYNPNVAEVYEAVGTFTLPAGVSQTNPATELKVTAKVYTRALPQITCPGTMKAEINSTLTLEGSALPLGGEYSGEHVSDGKFNSEGLNPDNYTVTYTYTDPVTGCSNSCEFTIAIVVEVEEEISESIKVYPNPSRGEVNIKVTENSVVRVTDAVGKIIATYDIRENDTISFTQAPGMYFVHIESNGKVYTQKLIIE